MTIHDKIYDKVNNIDKKLARVEEHVKSINGTIERHELDINTMRKVIYKFSGGIAVVVIVAQIISYIIK